MRLWLTTICTLCRLYAPRFATAGVYDPTNPFNSSARPNSWTPPLTDAWNWSRDRIHGVNLGGLFVLEPFIVPALFERAQADAPPGVRIVDEWTLSALMANDTANGGLDQIEKHYQTFIVRPLFLPAHPPLTYPRPPARRPRRTSPRSRARA